MDWVAFTIWIVCLSPIWGAFILELWEGTIKPYMVPAPEIKTKVIELHSHYGEDAFDQACIEERSAWQRSDTYQQGRWRRIRRKIMKREKASGFTFSKLRR